MPNLGHNRQSGPILGAHGEFSSVREFPPTASKLSQGLAAYDVDKRTVARVHAISHHRSPTRRSLTRRSPSVRAAGAGCQRSDGGVHLHVEDIFDGGTAPRLRRGDERLIAALSPVKAKRAGSRLRSVVVTATLGAMHPDRAGMEEGCTSLDSTSATQPCCKT